jgi:hypothetical protein
MIYILYLASAQEFSIPMQATVAGDYTIEENKVSSLEEFINKIICQILPENLHQSLNLNC